MAIEKLTSQSLASGAVTSDAIATGAITVDDIPNGEITAAKLHTTAIQDKLGYTPVSANNPTFTGTITFAGQSGQQIVFDRTMGDNWIGSSVVIENGNISVFEPPTGFLNWLNSLQAGDTFTIQPGGQEVTVASTSYNQGIFLVTTVEVIDETPGQGLQSSFWITSLTQDTSVPPDILIGSTPLGNLATKDTVSSSQIVDSSITSAKIANGAISESKIIDGAISNSKIIDGAISNSKIIDGAITASKISNGTVVLSKLGSNALFQTQFNIRTSQHTLVGDSGWVDHLSITFTTNVVCNCLFIYSSSASYESGTVQGFARLLLDGTMVGYNSAVAKQSTANSAGAGTCIWDRQAVSIGTHTIKVQLRNTSGTWITPYWNVDGQTGNALGVIYYA